MTPAEQLRLIKSSKHLHSNWYRETYPEVSALQIEPAQHYLRYGAAMGRNPGKNFDTRFYMRTYPDAAKSGMNPVVHYMLHGRDKGYATRPPKSPGAKHVASVRTKLLSLGFTERPLQELAEIHANAQAPETRALAARELALWHMRAKTPEGYRTALTHIEAARADAPDLEFRRKLATVELLCHHFLGDDDAARDSLERAVLAGETSPDLILSSANLVASPEGRVARMNRVLAHYGIPAITLSGDDSLPAYDRLTTAAPLAVVTDGPKVTVLIAAYEAADTLPTALRSLQEQTWQNLEILVLDDCSPSEDTCRVAEEFAARDPRIRVIRMEQNGGAYVARNRGLDEATGDYVTLHDADDWSHPLKIETQVRFMEENPEVMGSTSQQARIYSNLAFTRWTGDGCFIIINTSSFMFRRAPVREQLGYWDTVRFSGDNEFIRRLKSVFGQEAFVDMRTGPLSFQRDSDTSVVADEVMGINGFLFGARRMYADLQSYYRRTADSLGSQDANGKTRRFPVPAIMRSDRTSFIPRNCHFPVILASDFRMTGGSTMSCVEEMKFHRRNGIKLGLAEMFRYDLFGMGAKTAILDEVHEQIDGETVQLLAYGDKVTCDTLIIRYPPVLQDLIRYMPQIEAKTIRVIVNQPPMSDYGPNGLVRYDLETCAANIRHYFGKDAIWHPIGPLVRDTLIREHAQDLHHIDLSDVDWSNIIDLDGWDRGSHRPAREGKLRIGRHSRDHEHKWPSSRDEIISAYPMDDDIEVHVLGGGKTPKSILRELPNNWIVHDFGSIHPRDFLKDIDVWIYFSNPNWIESFGRTIIEAMATGIPVILPEVYRPLFREAALYATPETAVDLARTLYNDVEAYEAQIQRAQDYVLENFSYDMHRRRIAEQERALFYNTGRLNIVA